MQVLHFAYGVGAFISPFIAEPFLLPIVETEVTNPVNPMTTDYITATMNPNATSFSFWESGQELLFSTSNHINSSADHLISPALSYTDLPTFDRSQLRVQWAYAIVSIYNGCVLIMFLVVYFSNRSNKAHPSRLAALQSAAANIAVPSDFSAGGDAQKSEPYSLSSLPDCSPAFPAYSRILVIIFSTLFMHVYCGLEISFGALLAPFTVKSSLQLNKSLSSFITSLYWGTFTFFRILTMLVITYCKPRTVLIANMIIIMGSNVLLLPYGDTCLWALWLGVGLMGLGCSSVFATMIGYVEQMFPVTSRITSGYMTFACLGEFIIPYIVGLFIETNPRVYLYVVFAYSVASCILLMLIMMVQVSASRKARMYLNRSAISNTTNVN